MLSLLFSPFRWICKKISALAVAAVAVEVGEFEGRG